MKVKVNSKKKTTTKETTKETKATSKTTKNTKKQSLKINNPNPKQKSVVEEKDNEFSLTIGRVAFKNIVDLVSEALPSKEYGDAKSGIYMETKYVDDEPMLFMTANSLNVFISHGIKLQDDIGEGFVIPNGKSLKKIAGGLQSLKESIDISLNEDQLSISCGDDYESTIQHYDASGFVFPPTLEEIEENDVITLPVKFIQEALNKVAFACSSDMTIPELTGILIEQENNAINIVGGDGNRLSYLTMKSKIKNPKKVIVGVRYLSLFNSILKALEVKASETLTLYLSEDKIYFVIDNTIIGIQIFAGEYPIDGGYEQFVIAESDCKLTLKLNTEKFLQKLDLAVLHNNSAMDPITMNLSKKEFKFSDSEISANKFNIEFSVDKFKNNTGEENIEVILTPSYLYDVVKCLNEKEFLLSFVDEQGPAIVRPVSETDSTYIHVFSLN